MQHQHSRPLLWLVPREDHKSPDLDPVRIQLDLLAAVDPKVSWLWDVLPRAGGQVGRVDEARLEEVERRASSENREREDAAESFEERAERRKQVGQVHRHRKSTLGGQLGACERRERADEVLGVSAGEVVLRGDDGGDEPFVLQIYKRQQECARYLLALLLLLARPLLLVRQVNLLLRVLVLALVKVVVKVKVGAVRVVVDRSEARSVPGLRLEVSGAKSRSKKSECEKSRTDSVAWPYHSSSSSPIVVTSSPSSLNQLKKLPCPSNSSNSSFSLASARGAFFVKSWSAEVQVMGVGAARYVGASRSYGAAGSGLGVTEAGGVMVSFLLRTDSLKYGFLPKVCGVQIMRVSRAPVG